MSRFRALEDSDSEHDSDPKLSLATLEALRQRRDDEMEAVGAMYGDDVEIVSAEKHVVHLRLRVGPERDGASRQSKDKPLCFTLCLSLDKAYPAEAPFDITVDGWPAVLPKKALGQLCESLRDTAKAIKGEEAVVSL